MGVIDVFQSYYFLVPDDKLCKRPSSGASGYLLLYRDAIYSGAGTVFEPWGPKKKNFKLSTITTLLNYLNIFFRKIF